MVKLKKKRVTKQFAELLTQEKIIKKEKKKSLLNQKY
jgi:hypothetical protein